MNQTYIKIITLMQIQMKIAFLQEILKMILKKKINKF